MFQSTENYNRVPLLSGPIKRDILYITVVTDAK